MSTKPALGINLSSIVDWGTELPFVDIFKMTRPWISQRVGGQWGSGPPLELDANGWVRHLQPNCYAETLIFTSRQVRYPTGNYTVLYEGEGELDFGGPVQVTSRQPGRITLNVTARSGPLFLRIRQTNPNNYVRNIRWILPGFLSSYQREPFHPSFLRRWSGVACIRFMDWGVTNNSTLERWSDRPRPEHATYMERGAPVEVMMDLCNRLKTNAWLCVPHQADDDYVRQLARLVHSRLHMQGKVYLEYSNETWNSIFTQYQYCASQGRSRGFANTDWESAWRYHAYRAVQIFKIWEQEVGRNRLVRVLASQSANTYVGEQIMQFQSAFKNADALAIAPYFGPTVTPNSSPPASEVQNWTVEQALNYLERNEVPRALREMKENKAIAQKYGLRLLAYEGGPHLVGGGGAENNEATTQLCMAVNRHPRMRTLLRTYLDGWTQAGGELFCYFASVSEWSKWGCWGVYEYHDEEPRTAPKYTAIVDWARRHGQGMGY